MLTYNMHSPIQLAFYCMSFKTSTKSNFILSKDEYTLKTINKGPTRETKSESYSYPDPMSCVYGKHTEVSKTHKDVFFLLQA